MNSKVEATTFKKTVRLVVAIAAVWLAYEMLISFIPEDKIIGFHWPR